MDFGQVVALTWVLAWVGQVVWKDNAVATTLFPIIIIVTTVICVWMAAGIEVGFGG